MNRITAVVVIVIAAAVTLPAGVAGQAGTATTAVDCEFPVTATDATGTDVTVSEEPKDVVVLAPSAAQTMWAIDAEEKVVGMPVNTYTAYLEGSEERVNVVGQDGTPIQEEIVALEPDLVLAPNVILNETVENLRRATDDVPVYRFRDAKSLSDVAAKTELTGRLVGEFDTAASVSAETRGTVDAIEEAVADEERPRAYYVLGGGWSAGNGTFINELITAAGARNIAADAGINGYQEVNPEIITERDPEILVVPEGIPVPDSAAINGTTAVQEDNIVRVDANFINQPGPETMGVLRNLAGSFHPDPYESADIDAAETPEPTQCQADLVTESPTPTDAPTETDAPTATTQPDTATETPGASGPGFTAAIALLAMVGALLLGRR